MATWTIDEPGKVELDQGPVRRVLVKRVEARGEGLWARLKRFLSKR
jgi:hypothetical protein